MLWRKCLSPRGRAFPSWRHHSWTTSQRTYSSSTSGRRLRRKMFLINYRNAISVPKYESTQVRRLPCPSVLHQKTTWSNKKKKTKRNKNKKESSPKNIYPALNRAFRPRPWVLNSSERTNAKIAMATSWPEIERLCANHQIREPIAYYYFTHYLVNCLWLRTVGVYIVSVLVFVAWRHRRRFGKLQIIELNQICSLSKAAWNRM